MLNSPIRRGMPNLAGSTIKRECDMLQRWLRWALLACGLAVLLPLAEAQDFPSKAIKIIVPNPPGGAGDTSKLSSDCVMCHRFHLPNRGRFDSQPRQARSSQ